ERRLSVAIPALFGAAGLMGYAFSMHAPVAALAAITLAAAGMWSILGPFWALSAAVLAPRGVAALAGGLAFVNSVGNLGGFCGPFIFGLITEKTKSEQGGVVFLAVFVFLGALTALSVRPAPVSEKAHA
ncbi:MAG: MFS transporter, partial [Armatimonadota bacterium]